MLVTDVHRRPKDRGKLRAGVENSALCGASSVYDVCTLEKVVGGGDVSRRAEAIQDDSYRRSRQRAWGRSELGAAL